MFKFLRKIFVLGLVFSLSIPSFAAVSVSDGSAFVSKAEFSASLNNLSSRMSNLENSLDAKIDSLVSSYLSRNGIWNGEKQTFTALIFNGNVYNTTSTSVAYHWYSALSTNSYAFPKVKLCEKISKSGLCFVTYSSTNTGFYYGASSIANDDYIQGGGFLILRFYGGSEGNSIVYTQQTGSITVSNFQASTTSISNFFNKVITYPMGKYIS